MADYCREKLSKVKGIQIISPSHHELRTGIVSVTIEDANNAGLAGKLKEKDIIVKTLPGINALRFSCHVFVSEEDIDRLISELDIFLG